MALDLETEKELLVKVGKEATEATKREIEAAEKRINETAAGIVKGVMTEAAFEDYKKEQIEPITQKLEQLLDVTKEQGNKINLVLEKATPNSKSFAEFIEEQAPKLKELMKEGKSVEFTASQLKAAGVTSVSGSVQDMSTTIGSPYSPGLGGVDLEVFDIARNPNFILNQVDLGRTNAYRLAWINETDYQGAPAEVSEGGTKPQTQHKFQVETSTAKKMAAYIELTEEFDQDLPGLSTRVQRMLRDDVIRGWDDAIQLAVIAAAMPFAIHDLDNEIQAANLWDALNAMKAQIISYNFNPNTIGINPFTDAKMQSAKASTDEYLLPPFAQEIMRQKIVANKVATGKAFVGDLKQYKVDVYKEFVLKMGLINDNLITNKFCIVGEVRYHRYISDARKKAICYHTLNHVATQIDGTPGSAH